jgi:outer membrane protein TolC
MDEQTPLPADLQSAHAQIRHLQKQLAQTRRLLVSVMGYDPTDTQAVFGYSQAMSDALRQVRQVRRKKT